MHTAVCAAVQAHTAVHPAHCKLVRNVASTLHSLKTNAGARSTLLSQIQVKAFGCELNF